MPYVLDRDFNILEISMCKPAAKGYSCSHYKILKSVFHMDAGSVLLLANPASQALGSLKMSVKVVKNVDSWGGGGWGGETGLFLC